MSDLIRIVYLAVDKHNLTLYAEGSTTPIIIPQGDPRVSALVDKIAPDLEEQKYSDITPLELSGSKAAGDHFAVAEDKLDGLVKFFKVFKDNFEELEKRFNAAIQDTTKPVGEIISLGEIPKTRVQSAISEVMANAVPASSPSFSVKDIPGDRPTTIVAVLDDGQIIPGMENLDTQLRGVAAKLGSEVGVAAFFERLKGVKRGHTTEDLLKFMEKGELPIADDGSILVYKLLKSTGEVGVFVDVHTGKVKQKVGSKVFMDESLVDPNRHQDCSNGLHVARRDYLHSFSGDICVLAKLAPEDIIAVPHSDARKVRATGYHIIARLTNEDRQAVSRNEPIADEALLGNAAAGNHVGITQLVQIGGQQGTNVTYTDLDVEHVILEDSGRRAESLDTVIPEEDEVKQGKGKKVNPTKLASTLGAAKAGGQSTRAVRAAELAKAVKDAPKGSQESVDAAQALLDFKKASKKGWEALGLTSGDGSSAEAVIAAGVKADPKPKKADKSVKAKPAELTIDQYMKQHNGSPRDRIQFLLQNGTLTNNAARAVLALKKQAKKSWDVLGVTEKQLKVIIKLSK